LNKYRKTMSMIGQKRENTKEHIMKLALILY